MQCRQFLEKFVLACFEFGDLRHYALVALRERIGRSPCVTMVMARERRIRHQRTEPRIIGLFGHLIELGAVRRRFGP